jgi:hypothetical protein
MKKIFITGLLWGFLIPFIFSQDGIHVHEAPFVKRIENNMFQGQYNLNGKVSVEKLFFGDFNAFIEFAFLPSYEAASGFRIVRNSSGSSYTLELKYVSNYEEAHEDASKKYPSTGLSPSELSSISDVRRNQIMEHNRVAFAKQREEIHKSFKIETRTYPVSNRLAEKLHQKMVLCINNFEAKTVSDPNLVPITRDGYSITFRTVVDNAVLQSLWVQNPNEDTLKMADFCREIIADAKANKLDEGKYLSVLSTFESQ